MKLKESLQVAIIISLAVIVMATASAIAALGSPSNGLPESVSGSNSDHACIYQIDSLLNLTLDENLRELRSREVILENQSWELRSQEENASVIPADAWKNVRSLGQYECHLRERAIRLAIIEAQLREEWPYLDIDERIEMTRCLEGLLRGQAVLLYDFQSHLKRNYCKLSTPDQKEFLASFEDLLERESELLKGFEDFGHRLQDAPAGYQIEYLASFEDLIRRQAVLLEIYQRLLKTDCHDLRLYKYIKKCGKFRPCQDVTYYYILQSISNCTISSIRITDDQLGEVAQGISLQPYEMRVFAKNITLDYPTGERICNTAHAIGTNCDGLMVTASSNEVCITIEQPVHNQNLDSLTLGDQRTIALAADPAVAENSIIIKKSQGKECCSNNDALNYDVIDAGDQLAGAFQNSRASNRIKVVANQK